MTPKYLRIVFLSEFLVAVIAIFTAWSEIGGQATLDIMPWSWKSGLGLGLAVGIVGYTAALYDADVIWNLRTARWLTFILAVLLTIGAVTYFYVLQADSTQPGDEQDNSATALHSYLTGPAMPES
jgi:hypothetical protein